ncbi:XRE family transcriptional regulator [Umezawaea sp. Da 62-37]|uniref:XRE family transcriptional regulator n=1 Tax=Umezawaea sp. Da 62-37 TaxID=3075927 RepID=UPI0028F733BD|nr:XRE family transcriptional regulator [Umezawaea sp. Da 62-37]WNV83166.1 XRE family transcriptional regulator [Umezawaea sp. Da 62-37]
MAEGLTLAETIDGLFKKIRRPGGREHSMESVAKWCTAWLRQRNQAKSFSKEYLRQLRAGIKDNPTKSHLEALAAFFEIDAAIFLDSDKSRQIQADLELVLALREVGVQAVAMRSLGLTPSSRQQVLEFIRALQADQVSGETSTADSSWSPPEHLPERSP